MRPFLPRVKPIAVDIVLVHVQSQVRRIGNPPPCLQKPASLIGAERTHSLRRATGPEAGLMRGLAQAGASHTPRRSRSAIAPGKRATPPAAGDAPHPHGWSRDSLRDAQLLLRRLCAGLDTQHTHTTYPGSVRSSSRATPTSSACRSTVWPRATSMSWTADGDARVPRCTGCTLPPRRGAVVPRYRPDSGPPHAGGGPAGSRHAAVWARTVRRGEAVSGHPLL